MAKDTAASGLIEIADLSVGFTSRRGHTLAVLRDVSLSVARGETVGIVGESGSGKSTVALAAMGFLKPGLRKLQGDVRFAGQDVFARSRPELEGMRGGKLGLIPQNSGQALTPTMRIGRQLCEALALHCKLEMAECPARAAKLLEQGVTDMVRISDARMSGTAYGTVVLHTAPEAAAGGPLALVRDGDMIELDVPARRLQLDVDDAELERRRQRWIPPEPEMAGGYQRLYVESVLQADRGADLDFLVGSRGHAVPREAH